MPVPCTRYTYDAIAGLMGLRRAVPATGMDDAFAQEILSHIIRLSNENEDLRRRNKDHMSAAERHHNVIKTLEQENDNLRLVAQEYNDWIRYHAAANGSYDDFLASRLQIDEQEVPK